MRHTAAQNNGYGLGDLSTQSNSATTVHAVDDPGRDVLESHLCGQFLEWLLVLYALTKMHFGADRYTYRIDILFRSVADVPVQLRQRSCNGLAPCAHRR